MPRSRWKSLMLPSTPAIAPVYVAVQNERKHPSVPHHFRILSANEAEHAVLDVFREVRTDTLRSSRTLMALTLETKINVFPWDRRGKHDVHPALVLAGGGIEFDHLAYRYEMASRTGSGIAAAGRQRASDTGSSLAFAAGAGIASHVSITMARMPGTWVSIKSTHAAGEPRCVMRPPAMDRMRMVPAISSASFIAAVWVQ